MADFVAPLPGSNDPIMRTVDPLLNIEGGFQVGSYVMGLGAARVDPMLPSDIGTPVVDIFGGGGHQFASPALNASTGLGGVADALDVFSLMRFLAEGR